MIKAVNNQTGEEVQLMVVNVDTSGHIWHIRYCDKSANPLVDGWYDVYDDDLVNFSLYFQIDFVK